MSITLESVDGPIPSFRACDSTEQDDATPAVTSSSIGRNSDCSTAGGGTGEELGKPRCRARLRGRLRPWMPLRIRFRLAESPVMLLYSNLAVKSCKSSSYLFTQTSRRGISKFYCGKSKSFASLSDAISNLSSAKELGKPENAYSRKRKNLLALSCMWEVPRTIASAVSVRRRDMPILPVGLLETLASRTINSSCFLR
ncbi:hypothetical protein HPP92_015535 [Vanilla planifolia]|uniref:Uncharacterized protein n=1 Tax=Vanilla planifolia TaxID=51239 RepID=A0A835QEH2_VANPL|nr:hypothetical protein HPP92_015535 [Vanilla planifolia]